MSKKWLFLFLIIPLLACTLTNPNIPTGGPTDTPDSPTKPPPTLLPVTLVSFDDAMDELWAADIPVYDRYDLHLRMAGETISPVLPASGATPQVGEEEYFWLPGDFDYFEILFTLRYVSQYAYFWVENGIPYNHDAMITLAETFDTVVYPRTREFFGSEWNPGVDGDPHIYIIYTDEIDSAGAYWFEAGLNPELFPFSDGHEIILLGAPADLDDESAFGTLAHEFQHLIRLNLDPNEETWLNEGFSELAKYRLGYYPGFIEDYTSDPDIPLFRWPTLEATDPHYGAGLLFLLYFQQRFGEDALQALINDPRNGVRSLVGTLTDLQITDPLTGEPVQVDDLFLDFAVMLYLNDPTLADGRYALSDIPDFPAAQDTDYIDICPSEGDDLSEGFNIESGDVNQYGIDYIGVGCPGDHKIIFMRTFDTSTLAGGDAHSGKYAMWSNHGENSNTTLTCTFDFTNASPPLTLNYWRWYAIGKFYDFAYLTALADGETVWTNLLASSPDDIYAGYNGLSMEWQEENVDISQFAGKVTQVRFDYVTGPSSSMTGFLVDDISIPEIGYTTDFESGPDCWQAEGFVRVPMELPQTFRLALIIQGPDEISVETVDPDQSVGSSLGVIAKIPLNLAEGEQATLVVVATNPFIEELSPPHYMYTICMSSNQLSICGD